MEICGLRKAEGVGSGGWVMFCKMVGVSNRSCEFLLGQIGAINTLRLQNMTLCGITPEHGCESTVVDALALCSRGP